jgi:nicotinamide riboside transporter PnuC
LFFGYLPAFLYVLIMCIWILAACALNHLYFFFVVVGYLIFLWPCADNCTDKRKYCEEAGFDIWWNGSRTWGGMLS